MALAAESTMPRRTILLMGRRCPNQWIVAIKFSASRVEHIERYLATDVMGAPRAAQRVKKCRGLCGAVAERTHVERDMPRDGLEMGVEERSTQAAADSDKSDVP